MNKKVLYLVSFVFVAVIFCSFLGVIFAQQSNDAVTGAGMQKNAISSVSGKILYTDFKKRGDSTLVVQGKNGEKVEVSLKDLDTNSQVLVTYRKAKDAKGKEINSAITLSVIRPASMVDKNKKK